VVEMKLEGVTKTHTKPKTNGTVIFDVMMWII